MEESFDAYTRRILSYVGTQNPLELLAQMPDRLESVIKDLSPRTLQINPAAGKWSITEIVAHLSDDELVGAYRIRTILGNPGTRIEAFDQARWAVQGKYKKIPVNDSLGLFKQLRRSNLQLLHLIEERQWQYYGVHAERGRESIGDIVLYYAGHDINHLRQIERIRSDV